MPAAVEWDFRAVTADECAMSCFWEYSRTVLAESLDGKPWAQVEKENTRPVFDIISDGASPAKAWMTMTQAERLTILGRFNQCQPFEVRELEDWIQDCLRRANGDASKALQLVTDYPGVGYVVWADFWRFGTQTVIDAFAQFARGEVKRFKTAKRIRGKGAVPHFHCLKWLAVYRLEGPRREHGVSFELAQKNLREFQRRNPTRNFNDLLPLYASHGAWSKALADAKSLLKLAQQAPRQLLFGLMDPFFWAETGGLKRKRTA